jgi:hypothetical protein
MTKYLRVPKPAHTEAKAPYPVLPDIDSVKDADTASIFADACKAAVDDCIAEVCRHEVLVIKRGLIVCANYSCSTEWRLGV